MSVDQIATSRRHQPLEEVRELYVTEIEELQEWAETEESATAASRLQTELALMREWIISIEASLEFAEQRQP